jgi:rSAM/selenodomain-associated transferase 1
MCKTPFLGLCKTRMMPDLAAEECMELQSALIKDTITMLETLPYSIFLTITPADSIEYYTQFGDFYTGFPQCEGNLGMRISSGISCILNKGFKRVIVMATDSPDLQPEIVHAAHHALEDSDMCIGPCKDGGYYLIGVKGYWPELFQDIYWSTEKVFDQTIKKAQDCDCKTAFLPMGYDMDFFQDLVNFYHRVQNKKLTIFPEKTVNFIRKKLNIPTN